MRYAVLLGISVVGNEMDESTAIHLAVITSNGNPLRLVRVIDTHDDKIVGVYRAGEEQAR